MTLLVELVLRFALGGTVVCVFSVLGEIFEPKTFSGLFGVAPTVALATLALTFSKQDGNVASVMGRSMDDRGCGAIHIRRGMHRRAHPREVARLALSRDRLVGLVRRRARDLAGGRGYGALAMTPTVHVESLKSVRPSEYALRFFFGGTITVAAGLASHAWGPVVGGLFLGFPAILPASLTLVKRLDGRAQAVDDVRGATLGSAGMLAFAAVVWRAAGAWPSALALTAATLAWFVVNLGLWAIRYGRPRAK